MVYYLYKLPRIPGNFNEPYTENPETEITVNLEEQTITINALKFKALLLKLTLTKRRV